MIHAAYIIHCTHSIVMTQTQTIQWLCAEWNVLADALRVLESGICMGGLGCVAVPLTSKPGSH
jgi:hypothetical protein